jgi:hypothetical protein
VLRTGGGHYIQAERLRHLTAEAAAALARAGRYRSVAGNLRVKDVAPRAGDAVTTDRFIVCHNPERAIRDAAVRDELVAQLSSMIEGSDSWKQRRFLRVSATMITAWRGSLLSSVPAPR